MSESLDLAAKQSYYLVQFQWDGSGGEKLYTDWTSHVGYAGKTFTCTPSMEVKVPKNDGVFSKQDCRITLPLSSTSTDFTQLVSNGLPFAPTSVTVYEIAKTVQGGPRTNVSIVFIGDVDTAVRNPEGKKDTIVLECLSLKSKLEDITLGVSCNHQCGNRLGDPSCKVDLSIENRTVNATVTAIDGQKVTVATNATISGKADYFFSQGHIKRNSVNLTIREWRSSDPLVFYMSRQPPTEWVGQVVQVVVGCDFTVETCRSRFNNENEFNGRGFAMPAHHPVYEDVP